LTLCAIDPRHNYRKNDKVWVKTHRSRKLSLDNFHGMPCILPLGVKLKLVSVKKGLSTGSLPRTDLLFVKLLFSILSWFRAASPDYSETKIKTITGEFTGEVLELDPKLLRKALLSMKIPMNGKMFKSKPSLLFNSTKAGPNSTIAVLGIGLDLVGWIMTPRSYIQYCLMCLSRGYWMLLNVFVLCSVLVLPVAIIYFIINKINHKYGKPLKGRLAVLKEARGKRRIIGITDWWTQVLFRPLHDDIYSFLTKLSQDGTKDQSAPIILMLKELGIKCVKKRSINMNSLQSMDLSAATDRLPVILQSQILNILGFEGDLWRNILDREWYHNGTTVKYAVGQPMGAYSSFAMLALTHHVIVRYSSLLANFPPNNLLYAVLGDDIAMSNIKVSKAYQDVFKRLGMEINPIKGFDGAVLEFAKQLWTINGYNLSPLGAKNILLFMRNVEFLPSLLYELLVKRFPIFLSGKPKDFPLNESDYTKNRNYRRSAEVSTMIPLVTLESLENLVSSLFFNRNKGRKDKFQKALSKHNISSDKALSEVSSSLDAYRFLRIRLRVLMSIGPRSGLWYTDPKLSSYICGAFYEGYWTSRFIQGMGKWSLWTKRQSLMAWIKSTDEARNKFLLDLFRDIFKIGRTFREYILLPFTYLPIENKFSPRFSHFTNSIAWILVVFSPSIWILVISLIKLLVKSLTKCYLLARLKFLSGSFKILKLRYLFEAYMITFLVIVLILSLDPIITLQWAIATSIIKSIVKHERIVRYVQKTLHSTEGYIYERPYDPIDSSITTLEKVADKVLLEDSGAYKQLVRMLRGNPQFEAYYRRKAVSEFKIPIEKKTNRSNVKKKGTIRK